MNKSQLLKKYYDSRSACQVLGGLIVEPTLINNKKYVLEEDDFKDNIHRVIYMCIYNLVQQGIKKIGFAEIETYLANADMVSHKKIFEVEREKEWLYKTIEDANIINFEYHYKTIRKFALLRSYIDEGSDVSEILDMNEIDPNIVKQQRDNFNNLELSDIIRIMDKKNLEAKKRFVIQESGESRKAGENASELRKKMKKAPSYGFNFESDYLNAITRGILGKTFMLETRDTGQGKSRICIKRLLNITAPYIWDYDREDFIPNPNGQNNSALYIGTEMDLYEELEPMMWAFISGVEEDKIKDNDLTEEEEERIDRAIEILADTKLFMEDEPNFGVNYLWQIIEEYKVNHNICAVGVDYIELTQQMISEYTKDAKGMGVVGEQILLDLSSNLKNMAKKFNVFIVAFTQTTDEARRDCIRDQRAVKGARSLPNKTDIGIVVFEPTNKELEKLQPIIKSRKGIIKHKEPNICYSFYKNRGNKIKNVKVWGYQDLGNMYYCDLFCTDSNYKPINIDPKHINVLEED